MKPPIEFRPQPRWQASDASAETPAKERSATRRSGAPASTQGERSTDNPINACSVAVGTSVKGIASDSEILAHKRAVKAAQMKRYRERQRRES